MTLSAGEEQHLARELLERTADDFYGLWELIGILSAARASSVSPDEARRIVRQLFANGALLIAWGHPNPVESEPLSLSELENVLVTDAFWSGDQPFAGDQVWLRATDLNPTRDRCNVPLPLGDLDTDLTFAFRAFPRWQIWKRGTASAYVIATSVDGIVHLLIRGAGPFVIRHLPILQSQATLAMRNVLPSKLADIQAAPQLHATVEAWRREHARGIAGAFSIPLLEAISLIYETIDTVPENVEIESAYPVRDRTGDFKTVRVVTLPPAG